MTPPITQELEDRASQVAKALLQPVGDDMPKEPLKVIAGAPDRPLVIGDIEIQCYVLEDETRVLSQRGLQAAIGMGSGGTKTGAPRIVDFVRKLDVTNSEINGLMARANSLIEFKPPTGRTAYAYPATFLVDLCSAVLSARDASILHKSQKHIAERCNILIRSFAKVSIIALVDEATGFQYIREERALATILEKFIDQELQLWTKTFPYEFYSEIFRLKGWKGPDGVRRPSVIGKYTNEFVYERLAPRVLEELRRLNPTLPSGSRRHKHHQWFTPDFGHPKLKEFLAGVMALQRAAPNWDAWKRMMDKAYPKLGQTMQLPLDDDDS